MKTVALPEKLWEKLQQLKLKRRKKSIADVIQEILTKSGENEQR